MDHILVVDDDRGLRLALGKALRRKGVKVSEAQDGAVALEALRAGKAEGEPLDVCLLDLRMPRLSGLEVLRQTQGRPVPVVVLTGHGTISDAVEAMRLGASNFVQKPVDADELWPILSQASREGGVEESYELLGSSPAFTELLCQLDQAATSDEPVLFWGETGTGKELCARRLHEKSGRASGFFVAVNATCIPADRFAHELFGHQEGPSSLKKAEGLLGQARGGTLFIDEVGDLPLEAQALLRRVLERDQLRPEGADAEIRSDARICAATHLDLDELRGRELFRADLYFRLSVLPLRIPPLREREQDVTLIARSWLRRLSTPERDWSLTDDGAELLTNYAFPGNVRELINLMKRAVLFAKEAQLDAATLAPLLSTSPFATRFSSSSATENERPSAGADAGPNTGQRVTLEELEREHICRLLRELNNISEVARIAGIDRRTLQRKMVSWGLRERKREP